jgi:predicted nuclease of predicted toxin-antitoxin system
MSLHLLVDMNLSVEWVGVFRSSGFSATHWSEVGGVSANDAKVMRFALDQHMIVFTHDLDFGTMLAFSHAHGPSVFQLRTPNVLPERMGDLVTAALRQYESVLAAGALVVLDAKQSRVRILPIDAPSV